MIRFPMILAAGLSAASLPAPAAGPGAPQVIRTVTIVGTTGLAYYSAVEGGFRFLGTGPAAHVAMLDGAVPR